VAAVGSVELSLRDSSGRQGGVVEIALLPRAPTEPAPLVDLRPNPPGDELELVQLLEDHEYRFVVRPFRPVANLLAGPPEILVADSAEGLTGRLRPGSHTGRLNLRFEHPQGLLGEAAVEVRSRKLGYLADYRWMLRDIAEAMSEVIMERFAPTQQRFEPDRARNAATLYQRFAFLQSLILGGPFDTALGQVLARPHRHWESQGERRSPARGIRASSKVAGQLAQIGPRVPWHGHPALASLPAELDVEKHEETLDTPPNRFVRFALEHWREVILAMSVALKRKQSVAPVRRGVAEARVLLARIDAVLAEPLFREVGELTFFPAGSQVLQRREGYREIFRAYADFEVASALAWEGGDDVYGAGQRDVAALYEYWAFFELAKLVSTACDEPLDLPSLVHATADGLMVDLRRGRRRILHGTVERYGRSMEVELCFNRSFPKRNSEEGSWTRTMRPDYSLRIRPASADSRAGPDDVWLHFDAKYRVDTVDEAFESGDSNDKFELAMGPEGEAKRSDLLKMHAYKDAIRRSVGAYVLYPGTEPHAFSEYHELLPGLGAFALRPGPGGGGAEGSAALAGFIQDVIRHTASQATQRERSQYWTRQSFGPSTRLEHAVEAAPFLRRPPVDTLVLLGFVRSAEQLRWIHEHALYNMRADRRRGSVGLGSRELAADLVVLYSSDPDFLEIWRSVEQPRLLTRGEMRELGYPRPRGEVYYCLQIERVDSEDWASAEFRSTVIATRERLFPSAEHGAPVTTTWFELVRW
jgi:Domain of unknown function (DUF2357)/PD-(D/E)XK nuclease superfamily